MPWLVIESAGTEGRAFPIDEAGVTIGRSAELGVPVQHRSLSRQHARITFEKGDYVITDLQSKNGTFVNELPVTRVALRAGDVVRCGEIAFRYTLERTPYQGIDRINVPLPALTVFMPERAQAASSGRLLPVAQEDSGSISTDRSRYKLQTLLRVGELLAEPGQIDAVLDRILALTFETLPVDRAAILLVDTQTGQLEPTAVRSTKVLTAGEQVWSRHIVDYVRKNSVAALFNDTRSDPRLAQAQSVMAQSICASMCVPLKPRSELIGVLYVDNISIPDRFGREDLDFLAGFANQAAMAIHNSRLARELERKAVLENNLIRFFPKAVSQRLMEAPASLNDAIDVEVTALFADISGFTTLSSRLTSREVFTLLNAYFPILAEAVFNHEGTLEKYIGDALLAVWGAPFRSPDDARRALAAAVQMQRGLHELSVAWEARLGEPLRIHVGLHTGMVSAGNLGVESYLQYATIGDPVNLASRICNVAGPAEIVISAATRAALGDCRHPLDPLPAVPLKGHPTGAGQLFRVRWSE